MLRYHVWIRTRKCDRRLAVVVSKDVAINLAGGSIRPENYVYVQEWPGARIVWDSLDGHSAHQDTPAGLRRFLRG